MARHYQGTGRGGLPGMARHYRGIGTLDLGASAPPQRFFLAGPMDSQRSQPVIDLVAIDMDGTLLDPAHRITPRVKAAINQARAQGVRVVLASGRPISGLAPFLRELDITGEEDFCIACNGAVVQSVGNGRKVVEFPLSYDDFVFCERVSRELGVHFQALDGHRLYTTNQDISPYTVLDSHLSHVPLSYRRVEDMDPATSFVKLMLIDAPEVLDAAIQRLPTALTDRFSVVKSAAFFLEVFDHRAGKGASLKRLADHLGIDAANVMAIGDQENDLTMLQYAGTSVAMGNAVASVKQVALHETATNADDGVARAIERFVLR